VSVYFALTIESLFMENILPPANSKANMRNYVEAVNPLIGGRREDFTWHRTGKVNMAYEALTDTRKIPF